MNIVPYVIAAIAGAALLAAGYLSGVRRGKAARAGLRALAESKEVELQRLTVRLEADASRMAEREQSLSEMAESLSVALASHQETLKSEIRQSVEGMTQLVGQRDDGRQELNTLMQEQFTQLEQRLSQAASRTDLDQLIRPLREREKSDERWRRDMTALLKPLAERERVGHELSHMDLGLSGRGELPVLLNSMCARVGLSEVVLTDSVGLPLAMSENAIQGDVLAGISALLVNVRERTIAAEEPAPYAFVVHDESHRSILHRVFTVEEEEYVLIAISQGVTLPHDVLDPVLPYLSQILRAEAWRTVS